MKTIRGSKARFDIDHVAKIWKDQRYGSCKALAKALGCSSTTASIYIVKILKRQKEQKNGDARKLHNIQN